MEKLKNILNLLIIIVVLCTLLLSGCGNKNYNETTTEETSYIIEDTNMTQNLPEGYDIKIQVIADDRMIICLTDPKLQEKYPTYFDSNEEYSNDVANWNINFGTNWSVNTVIPSDENYEKENVSLTDSEYV